MYALHVRKYDNGNTLNIEYNDDFIQLYNNTDSQNTLKSNSLFIMDANSEKYLTTNGSKC